MRPSSEDNNGKDTTFVLHSPLARPHRQIQQSLPGNIKQVAMTSDLIRMDMSSALGSQGVGSWGPLKESIYGHEDVNEGKDVLFDSDEFEFKLYTSSRSETLEDAVATTTVAHGFPARFAAPLY